MASSMSVKVAFVTGSRRVVPETTSQNTAALSALRRCGAELRNHGTGIRAEIDLWPE